jgi:CRP-like cAMP-binding protein
VLTRAAPTGQSGRALLSERGHFCTLLTSFEQQTPTPVGIYAACPTQVLVIDKARWTTLEHALPSLAPIFTRLLRHTLLEKLSLQRSYLRQDAATRYETFLATQPTIAQRVPQHLIAAYLGITPQSLSRLRQGSY